MKIGTHIREARKAKKWTQLQLADAIGVSVQAISQWERDQTSPSLDRIRDLSKHLDIKFLYLFFGHEFIAAPVAGISNPDAKTQKVPLIRERDIAANLDRLDDFLSDKVHPKIIMSSKYKLSCFAYALDYDALSAGFERGDLLIFNINASPAPGDWVCVSINGGNQAFLAKYASLSKHGTEEEVGIISQIRDLNNYKLLDIGGGDRVIATLIERRRSR